MPITDFTAAEASRLRLRHFTYTDLLAFMAHRNDPEVGRYQSWEGIRSFLPILIVPPGALFFLLILARDGLKMAERWRPQ
jgi:hypothetical protein